MLPFIFGDYPNIQGTFTTYVGDSASGAGVIREANGAFRRADQMNYPFVVAQGTISSMYSRVNLSASNSSAIYKDGLTTVNVNAIYGLYLIRAYQA